MNASELRQKPAVRPKPPTLPKPAVPSGSSVSHTVHRHHNHGNHVISVNPVTSQKQGTGTETARNTTTDRVPKVNPTLPKNPPVARVRPVQSVLSSGESLSKSTPDVRVPPPLPEKPPCGDPNVREKLIPAHAIAPSVNKYSPIGSVQSRSTKEEIQQISVSCSSLADPSSETFADHGTVSDSELKKQVERSPKVPPKPKARVRRKTTEICGDYVSVSESVNTESKGIDEESREGPTCSQEKKVESNEPVVSPDVLRKDEKRDLSKDHKNSGEHQVASDISNTGVTEHLPIKPPRVKKLKKTLSRYSSEDSVETSSASDTESSKKSPRTSNNSGVTADPSDSLPVPKPRHSKLWKSDEGSIDELKNQPILQTPPVKSQSLGSLLDSVEQESASHQVDLDPVIETVKSSHSHKPSAAIKKPPPTKPKPLKKISKPVNNSLNDTTLHFTSTVESSNNNSSISLRTTSNDKLISAGSSQAISQDIATSSVTRTSRPKMAGNRRTWSYERALDDSASSDSDSSPDMQAFRKRSRTVEVLFKVDSSEICETQNRGQSDGLKAASKRLSKSLSEMLIPKNDKPIFIPPHPLSELYLNSGMLCRIIVASFLTKQNYDISTEPKSSTVKNENSTSESISVKSEEICSKLSQEDTTLDEEDPENSIYYRLSDCTSPLSTKQSPWSPDNIYQNENQSPEAEHGYKPKRVAPPPPTAKITRLSPARNSSAYDEDDYLKPKKQEVSRVSVSSDHSYADVSDQEDRKDGEKEGSPGDQRGSCYEAVESGPYEEIPEHEYINEQFPRSENAERTVPSKSQRKKKAGKRISKERNVHDFSSDDDSDDEYIYPGEAPPDKGNSDLQIDLYTVHCEKTYSDDDTDSSSHEYIPMSASASKVTFDQDVFFSPDRSSRLSEESFSSEKYGSDVDADAEMTDDAKRRRKIYYIAKEIMTTEQTFVDILKLLNIDFRAAVDEMTAIQDRPVIPSGVLNQILNHLPQLEVFNRDLLADLENRVWNWEKDPRICDIFVKKGPFLKLYTNYIKEFENATSLLIESCRKYPVFSQVVKDFEASARCAQLELKDYMLKPIQRIPQYRLLLQDYLKHLPVDSPDYADAKSALGIVSAVADHANDGMRYGDKVKRLLEIQNSLIGQFELVQPGRVLLKEGELMKLSRKEMQPRYFVLLNDVLLYTTPVSVGFKLNNALPLTGMRVCKPKREDFQNEFSILSTQRSFTLCASTPEERDSWLKALSGAVSENLQRRVSFVPEKAKMGLTVDQDFELGSKAPVWITDSRVSMCMLCNAEFTFTFRRHHCRACGKVVCGFCSDFKAPLKYLQFKPARVCEPCFDKLSKVTRSVSSSKFEDIDEEEVMKCASVEDLARNRDSLVPSAKSIIKTRFKGIRLGSFRAAKRKPSVLKEVHANDENADMSGYLKVLSGKRWKKMWFVLKDKVLYTYRESEDTAAIESKPLLGYNLQTFPEFSQPQWFDGVEPNLVFLLEHKGTDPTYFRTENEASKEKWTSMMREATVP